MRFLFITWLCFCILDSCEIRARCAGNLCLPQNYSKMTLPTAQTPYPVDIFLDVLQILEVDDHKFTVTMDLYLNVIWQGPRLQTEFGEVVPYSPVDLDFLKYLWMPDIFIRSLKSIRSNSILGRFAGKEPWTSVQAKIGTFYKHRVMGCE